MLNPRERNVIRQRVHSRIREKMSGTPERPRLNVYRSLNHIYTQLIDDLNGVTLASASSFGKKTAEKHYGGNVAAAKSVGKLIAERAKAIWRERGSPEGRDLEHWLEAEQQLVAGEHQRTVDHPVLR